jgi:hypothetical protein
MSFQRKLEIDSVKKLIDINGDIINFEAEFLAQSETLSPFYFIIADQGTLDQEKELEFKYIEEGSITGKISFDKNVHTNYYMVIKADNPTVVVVQVEIKSLPVKPVEPEKKHEPIGNLQGPQLPQQRPPPQSRMSQQGTPNGLSNRKPDNSGIFKLILILAILIIGGFLLYKFYMGSKDSGEKGNGLKAPSYNFMDE